MWGAVGDNQIGIIHSAAMPVKYSYDVVLDNAANNKQVCSQTFGRPMLAEAAGFCEACHTVKTILA